MTVGGGAKWPPLLLLKERVGRGGYAVVVTLLLPLSELEPVKLGFHRDEGGCACTGFEPNDEEGDRRMLE